jgi:hypothetical protein
MAFQKSISVRNAELDAIETTVGTAPVLKVYSGAEPADCAAADPSGVLATILLPTDWRTAAGGGTSVKLGTWSVDASASGTIASWRIKDKDSVTCHLQGNTTDMTFNNTSINSGQTLTVTTFTITAGNA